ncbi:hypothetical protein E5Q_04842 [Mixia osmundae IAM 14324]|uniref:Uncharacterized protein n=1 Tax=Mixia osmundae (strain CBS 9802 / IAM 14324 / JCM 22182 / KY 12970) TaxID=764103 RepID=G7E5P9_MIXOS|nr:hypothetical protein E5Q_04842 [Mixia osmundae IAM 14324]
MSLSLPVDRQVRQRHGSSQSFPRAASRDSHLSSQERLRDAQQ